jgi:hypothetical protein
MRRIICAILLTGIAAWAEQSTATIEGKAMTVKYTPAGDKISTTFHSDADLVFKGVTVPKGDYTLFVLTDGPAWQLVINKGNGAKAAVRDPKLDLGKVPMTMAKSAAAAPVYKVTLTKTAALAAKLEVVSGSIVATTSFHLDRVAGDSEW